LFGYDFNNLK